MKRTSFSALGNSLPAQDFDDGRRLTNCKRADGNYEQVYMRRVREGDTGPRYSIDGKWYTPVEGLARIMMPRGWEPS